MSKWIRFVKGERLSGRKTDIWRVRAIQGDELLGEVRWYGGWRRYVFEPDCGAVFEQDCLRDIADFCEEQTKLQKANRTREAING